MTTQVVELPPPRSNAPMLTRIITDSIIADSHPTEKEPVPWVVGQQAPYLPKGWMIRRMFSDDGSVEVYAVSPDGKYFIRHLVPMARVRLIEESMSLEVFVDEIAAAEEVDDEDEEEQEEPEPEVAAASNGQPST